MSNDMFAELTADERSALEYEIEGKLELYNKHRIVNFFLREGSCYHISMVTLF